MKAVSGGTVNGEGETAVLVAVQLPRESDEKLIETVGELEALARTAGAEVSGSLVQKRQNYDPATVLGRGKVDEVRDAARHAGARIVIFDNDLTVAQQDRLQSSLGTKVIDRTALILDIFAQRAHTSEGKTQVELAQLSYLLPRIRGRGLELSRLGGGIGTRGPGETKLEEDRRRIRRRMRKLEKDLSHMESVRTTQRKQRRRSGLPAVCLVGYTNSGKSSLLNRLTGAAVLVEDQLFSTLDSTTRKLMLPQGLSVVISDTVGFIGKLPHELVAAFRSTLEVVREADLLVHVVDAMGEETVNDRINAVKEVLDDLGTSETPTIMVFNKVDLLETGQRIFLQRGSKDALLLSALKGEGIQELLSLIATKLSSHRSITLSIPAAMGDVLSGVYSDGHVCGRDFEADRIVLTVNLPPEKMHKYRAFMEIDSDETANNCQS